MVVIQYRFPQEQGGVVNISGLRRGPVRPGESLHVVVEEDEGLEEAGPIGRKNNQLKLANLGAPKTTRQNEEYSLPARAGEKFVSKPNSWDTSRCTEVIEQYKPDADFRMDKDEHGEIKGKDAKAFEPYVDHYEEKGYTSLIAKRLAKAECAGEVPIEKGVLQERVNEGSMHLTQELFLPEPPFVVENVSAMKGDHLNCLNLIWRGLADADGRQHLRR